MQYSVPSITIFSNDQKYRQFRVGLQWGMDWATAVKRRILATAMYIKILSPLPGLKLP